MKAFVFPGQGSQFKGMGGELFEEYVQHVQMADQILGYSIKQLCLDDPKKVLSQTQYTQPALFVVNALSYMKISENEDQQPDFLAGHSLGEYNALFAAGCFDFETGLRLVSKRAELMANAKNGSMSAVIGANRTDLQRVLQESSCNSLVIANLNTKYQNIVSGRNAELEEIEDVIRANNWSYVPLPVSGAFHSAEMENAKSEYNEYLRHIEFNWLQVPVISNVEALPYNQAKIKSILSLQLVSPVRWLDTILHLKTNGVTLFQEIGPGNVLSNLLNKIESEMDQ